MSQYRIVFQNAEQIVYELDRRKPPAEDAEKKKKTQWKKKKKKKKKARIPNGPLVAAALAHEDTGTRHCVLDIYFAKKDYRNTERICRYLHVHLDAVFIRVHTRWRSPKRGKGNEYWRTLQCSPSRTSLLRGTLGLSPCPRVVTGATSLLGVVQRCHVGIGDCLRGCIAHDPELPVSALRMRQQLWGNSLRGNKFLPKSRIIGLQRVK